MNTIRERRIPPAEVGQMLGRARMRAGLRGREAARLAGLSRSYLLRLETGERTPSRTVVDVLITLFDLDDTEREMLLATSVDDAGRGYWRRQRAMVPPG